MDAIAEMDQLVQSMGDTFYISRILVRQEAVSSSSMEGTYSTLNELLEIEEETIQSRTEAEQLRDYALVMETVIPQASVTGPAIIDQRLISMLYAKLMVHDPDYKDVPGEIRERVVWISGGDISLHIQPATIGYLRGESMHVMTQAIIERMAIAHAHFETVHPFHRRRRPRRTHPRVGHDGGTGSYSALHLVLHRGEQASLRRCAGAGAGAAAA
jgi:Fic family protein